MVTGGGLVTLEKATIIKYSSSKEMKIDCPNCFYPNDANAKCCDKCGGQIAWKEESYIGAGRSLKVLENISAAGSVIIRKKVTKAVEAIKKRNE